MNFLVADRVQETGTVSTGTGTVNLAGAVLGYQSFVSGLVLLTRPIIASMIQQLIYGK